MKILKAIRTAVKKVVDKIRKSEKVDKAEEALIAAILPTAVNVASKGAFNLTAAQANEIAKGIVEGLNQLGNKVLGEVE